MTKREIERKGFVLREGDKVMQIRNNYDIIWTKDNGEEGMGVFNGDIGVLEKVDKITNTAPKYPRSGNKPLNKPI